MPEVSARHANYKENLLHINLFSVGPSATLELEQALQ